MGITLSIKNQKGTVTVENADQRIRLRWRYHGKRYSISLGAYSKINLSAARKVVLQIELDMLNPLFTNKSNPSHHKNVVLVGGGQLTHFTIILPINRYLHYDLEKLKFAYLLILAQRVELDHKLKYF